MTGTGAANRLTFWKGLKELGWFFGIYMAVVGGPSMLQIGQFAFPHFRLTPFFQWIVDGWRNLSNALNAVIAPIIQPAIDWLAGALNLHLTLDPVWTALFSLMSVLIVGTLRHAWASNWMHTLTIGAVAMLVAFVGSIAAGVAAAHGGMIAQGLVAFAMSTAILLCYLLVRLTSTPDTKSAGRILWREGVIGLHLAVAAGVIAVVLASWPVLTSTSGLLLLAIALAAFGIAGIVAGLDTKDVETLRVGLTVLGGFATALLIVGFDLLFQLFGVAPAPPP